MKCSIIDRSTISFDHLATPLQHIILDRVAVGGGGGGGGLARSPGLIQRILQRAWANLGAWVNVAYKL